jgi:hypothetical protein
VLCAASVFAQGSVQFNNRVSATSLQTHIYASPAGVTSQLTGNGANDFPAGTTSWAGFTALSGSAYRAILMVNYGGTGVPTFGGASTDFRTGSAAGYLNGIVSTLDSVGINTSVNLNVFAWETKGTFTDATAAWNAWKAGTLMGGFSNQIGYTTGGNQFTPGLMAGLQSFNIYMVPEPSTMALAGLGAAALLIFRRRN